VTSISFDVSRFTQIGSGIGPLDICEIENCSVLEELQNRDVTLELSENEPLSGEVPRVCDVRRVTKCGQVEQ